MRDPVKRLRDGVAIDDRTWDLLYPAWVRALSHYHWTPVDVALRAAEWLVTSPRTRVLDVGSGVGKFCAVGALSSRGLFTGVEQRPHLVRIAREIARSKCIKRCSFIEGDGHALDWREFDALYLFNPFAEHLDDYPYIDFEVDLDPERFKEHVEATIAKLAESPAGTRLCTFHGLGAEMPSDWQQVASERRHGGPLALWVKQPPGT